MAARSGHPLINRMKKLCPRSCPRKIEEVVRRVLSDADSDDSDTELVGKCVRILIGEPNAKANINGKRRATGKPARQPAKRTRKNEDLGHSSKSNQPKYESSSDSSESDEENSSSESGEDRAPSKSDENRALSNSDEDSSPSKSEEDSSSESSNGEDDNAAVNVKAAGPANNLRQQKPAEEDSEKIISMFPWISHQWVRERVARPEFDMETTVDYILENANTIPKKEKAAVHPVAPSKAPAAASSSAGSSSKASTSAKKESPSVPVGKDYLNNYSSDFSQHSNAAATYLGMRFPWIKLQSFTLVLRHFNYHIAPTFAVIHQHLKNIDFYDTPRPKKIKVLISKPDCASVTVPLTVNKLRRVVVHSPSFPPPVKAEIAWVEGYFHLQADSGSSATAPKLSERDLQLLRARDENDLWECGICVEECIISEEMVQCANGCLFCKNCLRRHAEQAVYGEGKVDVICMNDECDARFLQDALNKALDPVLLTKLDERRTHESINAAGIEGLEKCKYCDYAVIFPVPPDVNKVFKCENPGCEREYCRICHVDWEEHMGKPCKEVETEDDTRKRREAEEKMADAVIRHCYSCKAPLMKSEGCNKMICKCGAFMCYICREPLPKENPYAHFCQHPHDPDEPGCQKCKKCLLWENAEIKDEEAVSKIQAEANKALAEAGKELTVGVVSTPRVKNNKQAGQGPRRAPNAGAGN